MADLDAKSDSAFSRTAAAVSSASEKIQRMSHTQKEQKAKLHEEVVEEFARRKRQQEEETSESQLSERRLRLESEGLKVRLAALERDNSAMISERDEFRVQAAKLLTEKIGLESRLAASEELVKLHKKDVAPAAKEGKKGEEQKEKLVDELKATLRAKEKELEEV